MNKAYCEVRQLLVVSHVRHYLWRDKLYAYGPYTRELDIWADLFPRIIIASPCREEIPPGDCLPFSRLNISILPQKETGGVTARSKLAQALALPSLIRDLSRAMRQVDAIHIRCPGNLGLLGIILAPLFSKYRVAKFAGQWNGYPGEPFTFHLQRAILRSRWWKGPVTVYGRWPDQPSNVVALFTSIVTGDQMARAQAAANKKKLENPLRLLYVGRLSAAKNVKVLISAMAKLSEQNFQIHCDIVGDGPERPALEAQAADLGLRNCVKFAGGVDFERVLDFYEQAHVLVLVSETEGWPKAIAEAMAFGLICIGSNRGLIPEMLGEGRGILVPPGDVGALTEALRQIAKDPQKYQPVRARAAAWAQKYSLENLREALRELLTERWQVAIGALPSLDW